MTLNDVINVPIDAELKREADELFEDLALDTQTAIRMFLKHSVDRHCLPFTVSQPELNAETIEAMLESERLIHDPNAKRYTDVDEMMRELLADV